MLIGAGISVLNMCIGAGNSVLYIVIRTYLERGVIYNDRSFDKFVIYSYIYLGRCVIQAFQAELWQCHSCDANKELRLSLKWLYQKQSLSVKLFDK
jgi:hypothetical protein